MAYSFNYEWYTVDVLESSGRITWEIKAKDKDRAIRQINKMAEKQNKRANDTSLPWWEQGAFVKEIYWDTIRLDRVGHNR